MIVHVKLFAVAKELVQSSEVTIELPEGSTIGQLRQALAARFPVLDSVLGQVMFAVDMQYVSDAAMIPAQGEVACIPPVSGG